MFLVEILLWIVLKIFNSLFEIIQKLTYDMKFSLRKLQAIMSICLATCNISSKEQCVTKSIKYAEIAVRSLP